MSEPLADWLYVREPADTAARSTDLARAIAATVPAEGPVHVLDLASGTGANVRYLVEHLPARQRWLVVDRSPDLLALQAARTASWMPPGRRRVTARHGGFRIDGDGLDCDVETARRDLRTLDDPALFAGRHLVTASALLDLVSESWLTSLAAHCRHAGASALFALTYNGASTCAPAEPEDDVVRDLLNRHQRTDKGLGGVAAGPDAVTVAERCFRDAGYAVRSAPSDWELRPDDRAIQRLLIDGWAEAAGELAPDLAPVLVHWRARRLAHLDAGRSVIVVGHHDLAAWRP